MYRVAQSSYDTRFLRVEYRVTFLPICIDKFRTSCRTLYDSQSYTEVNWCLLMLIKVNLAFACQEGVWKSGVTAALIVGSVWTFWINTSFFIWSYLPSDTTIVYLVISFILMFRSCLAIVRPSTETYSICSAILNFLPLSGSLPLFLERPASRLVTVLTELSPLSCWLMFPHNFIYQLTPFITLLTAKLTDHQVMHKFLVFYGTAFTSARHLSLSRARSIQSMPPNPISWRSFLILSSHIRLGLPSGIFTSRFFFLFFLFYWASVANAPNVLQPYWLIVLPLDVPDLTASLLLWGPSVQRWRCVWTFLFSNVPTFATSRLQEILAAKSGTACARNGRWILRENARLPRNIQGSFTCVNVRHGTDGFTSLPKEGVLRIFFALKNPTASVGFEPANLCTKGQHATSRPPKPLYVRFPYQNSVCSFRVPYNVVYAGMS